MITPKISFKLVRSFSIGFTIFSPSLNGLCFEVSLACFTVSYWSRGDSLVGFFNYWRS
jgi:hypothetical protein